MTGPINSFTNAALNEFQGVKDMKAVLQRTSEELEAVAVVAIITAVAFAALGMIMISSAACLIPLGIAGFCAYGAYNLSQTNSVLDAIIQNPKDFIKWDGAVSVKADFEAIKAELKENTFYFDWAIDESMRSVMENCPAPSA